MADEIQYQYAALQQGTDEMQRITQQIRQQIDDLERQTQQALQEWDSQSAETYRDLSGKISRDFDAINQMLQQLRTATNQGQEDMSQTDRKLASNF